MGTSLCVTPIKGRVVRVIKLDTCGNVVTGTGSALVVADAFTSIKMSMQYEEGTEYTKKRADGQLCVVQKDPPQLKRVSLEAMFCTIDPDLRVMMDGARLLQTSGVTGTGAAFNGNLITARFSLEVWQDVSGPSSCDSTGAQRYVYWAFPNVGSAQIKDFTVQQDVLEWSESAETRPISSGAAAPAGTWGAWPTTLPPSGYLSGNSFAANEHFAYNVTTVAPPTASCGSVTVT